MSFCDGRKRTVTIFADASLFLVVIGVAFMVGVVANMEKLDQTGSSSALGKPSTNKAVHYKESCVESLKVVNSSDPKELLKAEFESIKMHLNEAAKESIALKEFTKDPRTVDALRSCKEMIDCSIDQLQVSSKKLADDSSFCKIDEIAMDLKVWLSGALTFQETCLDGFQNTTTDAAEKMRKALNLSMELTSNVITMISEISATPPSLNIPLFDSNNSNRNRNSTPATGNHRLLQTSFTDLRHNELPDWLEPNKRKLLTLPVGALKPDLVVAQDGSGKYETINAALGDIPRIFNRPFVLYIKEGVYNEKVIIGKNIHHLVIVGDGPTKTKIVFGENYDDNGKLPADSATLTILGWRFIVRDIGVENSSGPEKHQAVAIRSQSDRSIYYNCRFDGYQDTVYAHANRQFYRNCIITGSIDFIFGGAAAVYQNCLLLVRRPLPGQQCVVTADGRPTKDSPAGIILHNCTITGDETYLPVKNQFTSYLGRPWKKYSRTVIMQSFIDDIIHPEGWTLWRGTWGLDTLWYGEFENRGPGSNTARRVNWKGYRKVVTPEMADKFTVTKFIRGNLWIPKTGVPFSAGLMEV